ncbi:hypothetical protein LC609_09260 [Nostoc sp. XA013]|nr:hypothetical protein [Nostoc sp. XA013]
MFVESTIVKSQERHALVIGGSIAGLLAAQVLTKYFNQVTIIERDHLSAQPEQRPGVPQAHHLHILHSVHCWHLSPVEQICHLQILKLQHHAAALTTLAQRNNCIAHLFF